LKEETKALAQRADSNSKEIEQLRKDKLDLLSIIESKQSQTSEIGGMFVCFLNVYL